MHPPSPFVSTHPTSLLCIFLPSSHASPFSCQCIPLPLHPSCITFFSATPPCLPFPHQFSLPLSFFHLHYLSLSSFSPLLSDIHYLMLSCIVFVSNVPRGGPVTAKGITYFQTLCSSVILPYNINITIAQSYTGKCHEFVAVSIASPLHE